VFIKVVKTSSNLLPCFVVVDDITFVVIMEDEITFVVIMEDRFTFVVIMADEITFVVIMEDEITFVVIIGEVTFVIVIGGGKIIVADVVIMEGTIDIIRVFVKVADVAKATNVVVKEDIAFAFEMAMAVIKFQ
jgi:hypothetical protein